MELDLRKLRISLVAQSISMLLFAGLLWVALWYLNNGSVAWVKVALMGLPFVPGIFLMISMRNTFKAQDEMMQKVQLEAISIAFSGVVLMTFGEALMAGVGIPAAHPFLRIMIIDVLWILGMFVAQRKYA